MVEITASEVGRWLDLLYIAAPGADLRQEDRRKALEVAAMLAEVGRAVRRFSSRSPLVLIDAAAGKSYLGLLSAKLLLEPMGRSATVVTIERDPRRAALSRRAAARLETTIPIECRVADLSAVEAWPERPSIVAALHACGPAADAVIEQAIATKARMLLLVPCCTSNAVAAANRAEEMAVRLGIPRQGPVRRRFIQALVDAERTWNLEAAGYETEVVEFVGATVTPHNLLWRSRLVAEPKRMAAARRARQVSAQK
ncbi:MAG: SAM-dependent methyltransferase [Acidobacteriia bacterium]|nr:SAM-dependent methyltransferase [Terriglobia bacterium]